MYFGVPWVSGAIHTETKPYPICIEIFDYMMRVMKPNLQIIKKDDKT